MLKRRTSDEPKVREVLETLRQQVLRGTAFASLGGDVVTKEEMWSAVRQIRPYCEFAIEPEPLQQPGQSQFHTDLANLATCVGMSESVDFNLVYLKMPSKVYTLIKATRLVKFSFDSSHQYSFVPTVTEY